jgi:hypothetical protein
MFAVREKEEETSLLKLQRFDLRVEHHATVVELVELLKLNS